MHDKLRDAGIECSMPHLGQAGLRSVMMDGKRARRRVATTRLFFTIWQFSHSFGADRDNATQTRRQMEEQPIEGFCWGLTGQRDTARVQNPFAVLFRRNAIGALFSERGRGRWNGDGSRGWCGRNTVGARQRSAGWARWPVAAYAYR